MQHNIVDILPLGLQKLLAKYLQEPVSFLWHENQATIGMTNHINIFYMKKTETSESCKNIQEIMYTFFFTIFTISWSTSLSATCMWTISPQFFMIVSNNFNTMDQQKTKWIFQIIKWSRQVNYMQIRENAS